MITISNFQGSDGQMEFEVFLMDDLLVSQPSPVSEEGVNSCPDTFFMEEAKYD